MPWSEFGMQYNNQKMEITTALLLFLPKVKFFSPAAWRVRHGKNWILISHFSGGLSNIAKSFKILFSSCRLNPRQRQGLPWGRLQHPHSQVQTQIRQRFPRIAADAAKLLPTDSYYRHVFFKTSPFSRILHHIFMHFRWLVGPGMGNV